MPAQVKGGLALRNAMKKFTPDLAKETQKEMAALLKPITAKARGFIPAKSPLSGWGKIPVTGRFPYYNAKAAKAGIGYKTTPSKPNRQGFTSLARIQNASASGAIYETAGRKNPGGNFSPRLSGVIVGNRKMAGRGIFRAWAEDNGKTNAAVLKAIELARDKFNAAVGYN
jgi:hypothetical protein